jgi:predicted P-loop ATPase
VFVGTVNPEGTYLKGQTGNTRFLPIACTKIWHAPDEAERLQLFAEATHVYQHLTEPWWTEPDAITQLVTDAREQRREASVYEEELDAWLAHKPPGPLIWPLIATHFLRLENKERWKDRSLQMEVGKALRALGYQPGKVTRDGTGKLVRPWVKDQPDAGDVPF